MGGKPGNALTGNTAGSCRAQCPLLGAKHSYWGIKDAELKYGRELYPQICRPSLLLV